MGLKDISDYAVHAFEVSGIGVIVAGKRGRNDCIPRERVPPLCMRRTRGIRQHLGQAILQHRRERKIVTR